MNTNTAEAIERLLDRRQAVPSKMVRDLISDYKALRMLAKSQREEIERLRMETKQEATS